MHYEGCGAHRHLRISARMTFAYPIMGRGKNKLAANKIKMAMSIQRRGRSSRKNKQYLWERMNLPFWNEMGKNLFQIAEGFSWVYCRPDFEGS